jgi:hypothetical protein
MFHPLRRGSRLARGSRARGSLDFALAGVVVATLTSDLSVLIGWPATAARETAVDAAVGGTTEVPHF